jgi:hypothetical protein
MVADEQEYGDIAGGQSVNAPGEFSLLGLAGFTGLIGVTAKENKVDAVFNGVVD